MDLHLSFVGRGAAAVEGSLTMRTRVGLLLLVAGLAWVPARGFAQTCTIGPFTSSTSMSTITSQAGSAPNGAVVCLQRGNTWNTNTGFNFTTSHPDTSRVTICASSGSSCSATGGTNPIIQLTSGAFSTAGPDGSCVRFSGSSGGYNWRNIDCNSTVGSETAYNINPGASNLTIEGGKITSFRRAIFSQASGGGAFTNNLKFGTCTNRVEFTKNTVPTSNAGFVYGGFSNSTFSVWIHDVTGNASGADAQSHMIDFDVNGGTPATGSQNFTIECSLIEANVAPSHMGGLVKLARGQNATLQDNTFNVNVPIYGNVIAPETHNGAGTEGQIGLVIRRNRFKLAATPWSPVGLMNAQDVQIYNNVASLPGDDGAGLYQSGFVQFTPNTSGNGIALKNIAVYNNTIYRAAGPAGGANGIFREQNSLPANTAPVSGVSIYNNLVMDMDNVVTIFENQQAGCNGYGTNGANIKNNFIYTPNDSTPQLWSCSGATNANSSPYNTSPGLVDPANGNFSLASGSVLAGKGISANAPPTDLLQNTRPSPPSIGAYDLGAGGVVPLQPPVLIQITAN